MNNTQAWDAVLEILEGRPDESLNEAARRCMREKRNGRWAAMRLLRVTSTADEAWAVIHAIARRGKFSHSYT